MARPRHSSNRIYGEFAQSDHDCKNPSESEQPSQRGYPVTQRYFEDSIRTHRWWVAIAATLLTPWIGPHVDQYVPVGQVLFHAGTENADRGFWVIAAVVLGVILSVVT